MGFLTPFSDLHKWQFQRIVKWFIGLQPLVLWQRLDFHLVAFLISHEQAKGNNIDHTTKKHSEKAKWSLTINMFLDFAIFSIQAWSNYKTVTFTKLANTSFARERYGMSFMFNLLSVFYLCGNSASPNIMLCWVMVNMTRLYLFQGLKCKFTVSKNHFRESMWHSNV